MEITSELRDMIAAEAIGAEVELRRVESVEDAERERFLGSPTVRVDGTAAGVGSRRPASCRLMSRRLDPLGFSRP